MYIPDSINSYLKGKPYFLDTKGMSGAIILMFPDMVLKIEDDIEEGKREEVILSWLSDRLYVPSLISTLCEGGKVYRLMERMKGFDLSSPIFLSSPQFLLDTIQSALNKMWNLDTLTCPIKRDLNVVLKEAEERVEKNLVDTIHINPGTFGKGGFSSPEALLKWLYDNKPEEDKSFIHGDFCLPNIFLSIGKGVGFIDLSRSGIGDKWNDIALISRSLEDNYNGRYNNGVSYSGYDRKMLFDRLGIREDKEKIRYYLLLDELF